MGLDCNYDSVYYICMLGDYKYAPTGALSCTIMCYYYYVVYDICYRPNTAEVL